MQMLQNENTISKTISPHGELDPAIHRSKREDITNELMMKLLTSYTSTGNQKIRIYAKCARRISIFCVKINLSDYFQTFLFYKGSAREYFYIFLLLNSVSSEEEQTG